MLIAITQKHIDAALKTFGTCPLVEALSELFDHRVGVGYNYWNFQGVPKLYEMPSKARSFAIKYDNARIDGEDMPEPTSIEFGDVSLNDEKEIFLQGQPLRELVSVS